MINQSEDKMEEVLSEIKNNSKVQEMKRYIQHGSVSTYDHCESVAKLSYEIDRILHLHADKKTLLTGAMLHDFYLYDWHDEDGGSHNWHGFIHADRSLANARKYFDVDDDISEVIRCHMWPLNIKRVPSSREAWIVCIADKYVSVKETFFMRK